MIFPNDKKIGLALGSGAARGFAHIGVIKVLEKYNIPIDFVAGSSIGALIGGLYAATKDIAYVEDAAVRADWRSMISFIDPTFGSGFIAGEKMQTFIASILKDATFSTLKIPFATVATSLNDGQPFTAFGDDLNLAIRASISMPFVFCPVHHEEKSLMDGGLSMPIPVSLAKGLGAEYVLAVDLESDYFEYPRDDVAVNLAEVGHDLTVLLSSRLAKEDLKSADLVVAPKLHDIKWNAFFSPEKTKDIIRRGEEAMERLLSEA
ncbi:MAG: patatin-like phospholipase family protein [Candidatus Paceibacterota bacterium]|jgi:NTE family protein|nr:patatin-like phospholipase family protein [Candidatus Paceibacterota bacterium]